MSFTSPLMFSTIDDVIIMISVLSQCSLFSQFLLNNSIVVYDHVDLTFSEFDVFPYTYSYSFNISSFGFIVGESDLELAWKNIGFQRQIIGNIKIFNTDLVSSDHVSVYEHRDILADFSGVLFSQFYCVVSGYSFTASIASSSLICKDLYISTFQKNVFVDVYFETLLVNSFTVSGEAFLQEVCFLPQSHHPLIQNSLFFANISNNLIFDGSRCCNVDVSFCSEFLTFNDGILIKFNFTFDLFKIIITTNSSCQGSDFDLPFSLIVSNQSITPSFSCKQIPSGFSFALMCEIDVVIPAISQLILVSKSDLFLLELEFYGYESNSCVTPVDINKGLTALGEEIEAEIHLQMDNEKYTSFEQFNNVVSRSSNYVSASQLSYSLFLVSSNCVQSMVPFTITFTPSNPVKLIFVENYIEIDWSSLNISIPIFCVDSIGFIVECTGNLSVLNSSFNYTSFELSASSLSFSILSSFSYSNHYVELEFNEQYFKTNISVVQKFAEILVVESSFIFDYSEDMLFDKSCTVLRLFVSLITQHHFLNISESNDISQLSFVTTNDQVVLSVVNDVLEIISYPRQSVLITLSYLSQSITLNLITNDCRLPKLNSQQRCLCPKGMEFNFFGECVECPLNYYSNLEFNSECRSCPFPRITLQKGSSDLDQCVCPLKTLDSIDSCLPCPHLAECGYGNLTGIQSGFRLNTDTWELVECVFWFNCQENSCRSRHAYGDLCQYCTEDAVFSRIYCIGKEHLLIKLLLLFLLVAIILMTDISMSKLLNLYRNSHCLLLSGSKRTQVIRSMSRFINLLFTIPFTVSIVLFQSASSVMVFFEFIHSIFKFDSDSYFSWCFSF
ncbi:hypothetical protein GEMRC1_009299 [Eukaryota sp. GEM-RC1]